MTEQNTTTRNAPATVGDLRALTEKIAALEDQRRELARALPPITLKDVCADGCNVDREFERDVQRFMSSRMSEIDVTLLVDDEHHDIEKWFLLTPRYEGRELPPVAKDASADYEDEDAVQYGVFDLDEQEFVKDGDDVLRFDDEDDADDHARELQGDEDDSRHGFPFAWNTGWIVEHESWIDDLRACGFIVYRYNGDEIIAGIDGGGYSFMGAHFAPFYARLAARFDWLVETKDGPRRIVDSK